MNLASKRGESTESTEWLLIACLPTASLMLLQRRLHSQIRARVSGKNKKKPPNNPANFQSDVMGHNYKAPPPH